VVILAGRKSPLTPTSANSSPTYPCWRLASSCPGAPGQRADSLAPTVLDNLGQVADDLAAGALIVTSDTRIRTRRLPVNPPTED
jgi:hypothetical protein